MKMHDRGAYPTGAANEFVAQKVIKTVASAKMVEDRWTIDEKNEVDVSIADEVVEWVR